MPFNGFEFAKQNCNYTFIVVYVFCHESNTSFKTSVLTSFQTNTVRCHHLVRRRLLKCVGSCHSGSSSTPENTWLAPTLQEGGSTRATTTPHPSGAVECNWVALNLPYQYLLLNQHCPSPFTVALNYQTGSVPMQVNQGFFRDNGGSGYILKPDFLRTGTATLITFLQCMRHKNVARFL